MLQDLSLSYAKWLWVFTDCYLWLFSYFTLHQTLCITSIDFKRKCLFVSCISLFIRSVKCRCLYMYFYCSCAHRLLIKCNVDYPSLDLYAHVVGFRLPEGEEFRANQGGVRIGYGKPGKSWNLKNFIFQAWKVMELNCPPWNSWKIEVLFDRLVTADDNQGQCKIERSN